MHNSGIVIQYTSSSLHFRVTGKPTCQCHASLTVRYAATSAYQFSTDYLIRIIVLPIIIEINNNFSV